jgi:hypothetical protein
MIESVSPANASHPGGRRGGEHDDVVRFGRQRPPRRWPAWPVLLVVAALGAAFAAVTTHGGKQPAANAHGTTPGAARAPVTVTEAGHRLLGAAHSWELFGLTAREVVRIQPAQGRITRTAVPPLASTGPVSFIAGPGQVIIRPLDFVPGYVVPDGRPARALAGLLSNGGPVFPGPAPGQIWVQAGNGDHTSMLLSGMGGKSLGASIRFPGGNASPLSSRSDGRGYVLVPWAGGVYDARPGGFHLITTGTVVAVGPARWLAVECGGDNHCADVVIDSASGARRILPRYALSGPPAGAAMFPGTISPDGSTAAVFRTNGAGTLVLHLIDLASGADDQLAAQGSPGAGTMAWSPDSRWLFVATSPMQDRRLLVIDARTRHVGDLGIALPQINQVTVENAPPSADNSPQHRGAANRSR